MSQWTAITALQSELNRVTGRIGELTNTIQRLTEKIEELTKKINEYDNMIQQLNKCNSYVDKANSSTNDSLRVIDAMGETDRLIEAKEIITNISGTIDTVLSDLAEANKTATTKKEEFQKEKEELEKQKQVATDELQRYNEVANNLRGQINSLMSDL